MRACILAVVLGLAPSASAQDKPEKASEVLKKAGAELAKKNGYHVSETMALPGLDGRGGGGAEPTLTGVVNKDVAVLRGAVQVWFKGHHGLVKQEKGSFLEQVDPDNESRAAGAARNPAAIIADLLRFSRSAAFGTGAALGERDCHVIDVRADAAMADQHLKEVARRILFPDRFPELDRISLIDKARSTSAYRVWVGKDDLLVYRVEWVIRMVTDRSKVNKPLWDFLPDTYVGTYTIEIKDYDKDVGLVVPGEVTKKLGIKEPKK